METDPPPPLRADRRRCREYLLALEEEQRKIRVFQRELPLCLDLVTQTIEGLRSHIDSGGGGGGGSEETVSDHGPVLEEFMPLKPALSSSSSESESEAGEHDAATAHPDADEKEEAAAADPETTAAAGISSSGRRLAQPETKRAMPDWLQSVQLWSQQPPPGPHPPDLLPRKPVALHACRKPGGAFHPFEKEKRPAEPPASSAAAASSAVLGDSCDDDKQAAGIDADTAGNGRHGGGKQETVGKGAKDKEAQSSSSQAAAGRKPRRCWAPELHRRFLQALQQLGGAHVATPKQIREHMKVDGLTNDEVKSHLQWVNQKYRLHTRRPSSTTTVQASGTSVAPPPAPQFVVVGGIWVPPPEYAAAAAAAAAVAQPQVHLAAAGDASGITAANKVYAPVATLLQPRPQKQSSSCSGGRRSGDASSGSPAVSSSSQTTSA